MLKGVWYNELGSEMNLSVDGQAITGTYQTTVGAYGIFKLYGATDSDPTTLTSQAVGFVVNWQYGPMSAHSVTSWSGQWQAINGQEVITTMWLLTSETDYDQDWQSTLVGKDVFTRNRPAQEEIETRIRQSAWSHPINLTAK